MLGIFVFHTKVFLVDSNRNVENFIFDQGGVIGVIIFFMLSGFLLAYKQITIPELHWKKRIVVCREKFHKLYLLYFITLFLSIFGDGKFPQSVSDWSYAIISLPFNLTFTQDLVPLVGINISYNGPSWYISAMFIIWFIVYSFPKVVNKINSYNKKDCFKCAVIIIFTQVLYKILEFNFPTHLIPINHPNIYMSWFSYYSPFYNLGFFMMGTIIGRLALIQNKYSENLIYNYFLLFSIAILIYYLYNEDYFYYLKTILFEIAIGVFLLNIMIHNSLLASILTFKPLVWFGNISASFFLLHGVINYYLRYLDSYVGKPLLFFISLFVAIILSVLSDKYLILKKDESILRHISKTS